MWIDQHKLSAVSMFQVFLIILLRHECSHGQMITLNEFKQEDTGTNCTHGLIGDIDTVVFTARVDFSEDLDIRYVYFQLKMKTDLNFLIFQAINVRDNCSSTKMISCEHIGPHVVLITIRIIAKKELSGVRIRGVVITSNNEQKISDVQIFPEITDSSDIVGRLFINGIEIPRNNNSYSPPANEADIQFKYECESKVFPCLIEISYIGLMKTVQAQGHVIQTFGPQLINISIKQALCSLDHKGDTFLCYITTKSKLNTRISNEINRWFSCVGLFAGLFISITCCVLYVIVGRKKSNIHLSCFDFKVKWCTRKTNGTKSTEEVEYSDNENEVTRSKSTSQYTRLFPHNFEDLISALKSNDTENNKLEYIPHSDDAFPFPDMTGTMIMRLLKGINFSVKRCNGKDNNDTCECMRCKNSNCPSTEWIQLNLIEKAAHKNVSKKFQANDVINSVDRTLLGKENATSYVTCDTDVIDKLSTLLKDNIHEWKTVTTKERPGTDML